MSTALYDRSVTASITDHRITNALAAATEELAAHGFTTLSDVAPYDVDPIVKHLWDWARAQGVEVRCGVHGTSVWARVQ